MLQSLDLMVYSEIFEGEELSLADVNRMTNDDLKDIGVSLWKHRISDPGASALSTDSNDRVGEFYWAEGLLMTRCLQEKNLLICIK